MNDTHHATFPYRALALLILASAAHAFPAAAQAEGSALGAAVTSRYESGVQSAGAALPASCHIGTSIRVRGRWLESRSVAVQGMPQRAISFSFEQPLAAGAWRASLNRQALEALDKVEVQDAQGGWTLAWSGKPPGALDAACPGAWFEAGLQGKPRVRGLRFSFRDGTGSVNVTHAGLLGG